MTATEPSAGYLPKVRVVVEPAETVERLAVSELTSPSTEASIDITLPAEDGGDSYYRALAVVGVLVATIVLLSLVQNPRTSTTSPSPSIPIVSSASTQAASYTTSSSTTVAPPATDAEGRFLNSATLIGTEGFVMWPTPPDDHDPHLIGRPMPGGFEFGDATSVSLVYVNSLGRPTVLDLTTGFQAELDIARDRSSERFLIDQGRVVTDNPDDSNLPTASDRAMEVRAVRPTEGDLVDDPSVSSFGPALCLAPSGCPNLRWTSGTFGDQNDQIRSLDGDPIEVLVEFFQRDATVDIRWMTIKPADGNADEELRIPLPMPTAVIWLATH